MKIPNIHIPNPLTVIKSKNQLIEYNFKMYTTQLRGISKTRWINRISVKKLKYGIQRLLVFDVIKYRKRYLCVSCNKNKCVMKVYLYFWYIDVYLLCLQCDQKLWLVVSIQIA